jgi:hypothetical protein
VAAQPDHGPRVRAVALLVGAVVLTVLLVVVAGAMVPSVGQALATLPVVVIVLVVGTMVVLARTLRR